MNLGVLRVQVLSFNYNISFYKITVSVFIRFLLIKLYQILKNTVEEMEPRFYNCFACKISHRNHCMFDVLYIFLQYNYYVQFRALKFATNA